MQPSNNSNGAQGPRNVLMKTPYQPPGHTDTGNIDLPLYWEIPPSLSHITEKVLLTEAIAIERRTQQQIGSGIWHRLRCKTLTASRFHLIPHPSEISVSSVIAPGNQFLMCFRY